MELNSNFLARGSWTILAVLAVCGGCNRSYYRRQADGDAAYIIQQKANHPHWMMPRQGVEIDPRSRMFDPFAPDFEPMPQDDPYSHEYMIEVDGKKGWRKWNKFGQADSAENPGWKESLPLDDNGVLLLQAERAYQLALVHSRDYQRQFETLYLSALDVSAERFRFDTQFFGGLRSFYSVGGADRTDRQQLEVGLNTLQIGRLGSPTGIVATPPVSNGMVARKAFATGSEMLVGIANSLTWNFMGADDYSSLTVLDFAMIQPLLRFAGRERVLEQLTLSERQLLANVRQMERYRQAFFVEIMTGRDAGNGATRRGGVFGGTGLEGFTGVGGGGFGSLGNQQNQATGTGNNLTIPTAGGFLGLLQSQQNIRIQRANINGLHQNLVQLRENLRENLTKIPDDPESIVRDRLQIAQARQALLNAETRLLTAETGYQQSLDQFKFAMGMPPSLCVSIDDNMLNRFNLIDPQILPVQSELTEIRDEVGAVNDQLLALVVKEEVNGQRINTLPWSDDVERQLRRMRLRLKRIEELRQQLLTAQLEMVAQDVVALQEALPRRNRELERLRRRYVEQRSEWLEYGGLDPCQAKLKGDVDPAVFDAQRLDALPAELTKGVERLRKELTDLQLPVAAVDSLLDDLLQKQDKPAAAELYRLLETQVLFGVPSLLAEVSADTLDLSLLQARARVDSVELTPVDISWDFAVELARRYRHDWMNARASLVDSWRLIHFNANALRSQLDVVLSGDITNEGDNPLNFSRRKGQLRVGLQWDGPWTRLRERNTYRQALIEFQQARRSFYAFEDVVSSRLRDTIRTIELNKLNFEERRLAVLTAIEQVILNDEIQQFREERGLDSGPTAARDAVSALSDLQDAQNLFLGIWINYEAQRIILDLDLGTMQLDGEGNWVDPGPIGPDYGLRLPEWDSDGPELFFEPTLETIPPVNTAEPLGDPASVQPLPEPQLPAAPQPPSVPMANLRDRKIRQVGGNVLSAVHLAPDPPSRVIRLPFVNGAPPER